MKAFSATVLLLCLMAQGGYSICHYEDILGRWIFHESEKIYGPYQDCNEVLPNASIRVITLMYPNSAVDEYGNHGTWTLIGFDGFEVTVAGRSYYSSFAGCTNLKLKWARDVTVRSWSCFYAKKEEAAVNQLADEEEVVEIPKKVPEIPLTKFVNDHKLIKKLNTIQSSWKAKAYPEFEQYTLRDMFNREGGIHSISELPSPSPVTAEQKAKISNYPNNFDWRNVNGENYVSPVQNQGGCGSCYAFASTGLLEARLRILTNNEYYDTLSVQDIVNCSPLTGGCNGGWPYLTGGRFAQDKGFVPEWCTPYVGEKQECNRDSRFPTAYVDEYHFVGGYYGAGNEALMIEELVNHGPMAVLYMVLDDFKYYKGGIYHHEEISRGSNFEPYQRTNHAVLLVGYGVEPTTGEKFWIVKNSWGDHWGEQGYFRIRRGTNEVAIESSAFVSNPML